MSVARYPTAETTSVRDTPAAESNKPAEEKKPDEKKSATELLIEDAENLLMYAATNGIDIGETTRQQVIEARAVWNDCTRQLYTADLVEAVTQLSQKVAPVCASSLRKCKYEAKKRLTTYKWFALVLCLFVVGYSVYTFIVSAECEAITKDIETANALAVTLAVDLQRPSTTPAAANQEGAKPYSETQIRNLQLFTSTLRSIDARALALQQSWVPWLVGARHVKDPFKREDDTKFLEVFQLPANLVEQDYKKVVEEKISVYQQVRHFAKTLQERWSITSGAITTGLLPTFYAILGALAYLIRTFDAQVKARTFTGDDFWFARLLIAGIAGLVIGLFTGFGAGHAATLPPLAIAFLAGYAVDVFFSFLDSLVRTFVQPKPDQVRPRTRRITDPVDLKRGASAT